MKQAGENSNSLKMVFRNRPENEKIVRTTAAVFASVLSKRKPKYVSTPACRKLQCRNTEFFKKLLYGFSPVIVFASDQGNVI